MNIINGQVSFNEMALKEMMGLTYDPVPPSKWSGWGSNWLGKGQFQSSSQPANSFEQLISARKIGPSASPGASIFGSTLRVGGGLSQILNGFATGGIASGLMWGVSEYVSSGLIGSAAAGGMSSLGQIGMSIGGAVGTIATGGSPVGSMAGTWAAGQLIGGGLAGTAIAVGAPLALAGAATLGATYLAGRGSYEVMRAGYNRRQRMTHSIDTAGSTAAFMNKNAFNMRSRAVESIRNNHLNARSAFGQEAKKVHFSSGRKYISNGMY